MILHVSYLDTDIEHINKLSSVRLTKFGYILYMTETYVNLHLSQQQRSLLAQLVDKC